ncbi:MAG: hypothetical protein J6K24_06100 [Tidjanibacter sp.]|nr:hypothetical protein [Tidjanibacter sp.]
MKKLLILCVVIFANITIVEAQIIRSSRGVIKERVITVEPEPEPEPEPKHTPRVRPEKYSIDSCQMSYSVGLVIGNPFGAEFSIDKRYNKYLSYGAGAFLGMGSMWRSAESSESDVGVCINAHGRVNLFAETLEQKIWQPYVGISLGLLTPKYYYEDSEYYRDYNDNKVEILNTFSSNPFAIMPELGVDLYAKDFIVFASLRFSYKTIKINEIYSMNNSIADMYDMRVLMWFGHFTIGVRF